jgi:DNA-binding XRE family transcriptional regulator
MLTESPAVHVGGVIKRYREEDLALSQADLAWLAAVSRGTISNVENGKVTPDERTWHRVRTALAWTRTSPEAFDKSAVIETVMPADAVQGIVKAILAIREQDDEMGARVAERWRRLTSGLTRPGGTPNRMIRSELAWLASEVAARAEPERLPAIHLALQAHGWTNADHVPSTVPKPSPTAQDIRRAVAPLADSINHMSVQVRNIREQMQGFERLPARVQLLLTHGLVADYEYHQPADAPGVTVVDLIILDEDASVLYPRRKMLEATRRWGSALLAAKHIFEELAPDRDPEEIIEAVERCLAKPVITRGGEEQPQPD